MGGRSTCTLVLFMLFMLSVVFLVLLALGIVSLPLNDNAQDGLSNEAGSSSSTEEIVDMINLQRVRTSSGTFLNRGQDEIIKDIENRIAEVSFIPIGISDVDKGGETVFPKVQVNSSSVPWWDELSDCAKAGISVRPRMGDALLFWSMHPDASLDSLSLHGKDLLCSKNCTGGCPVIQGDKWSATKWMRVRPYTI
ncbi:hypothetical protein EJ110_NYTH11271 [Nymphaea thermarum]|nr:hypothetical protein EJ110_NYTH11271 [Nymphaea thermarum]